MMQEEGNEDEEGRANSGVPCSILLSASIACVLWVLWPSDHGSYVCCHHYLNA
ncbi:hypothetical protein BCR39DRAFT_516925 [Naematelia encephala]|uniref:Uncharacterized protein n=1 Tax=Naematelia encephala TaxID=71784 RepID=A0A1Y2BHG0_9TREE|nr:hypothetical protein BCR39DRAFT_516925 [Naematelia encephala]